MKKQTLIATLGLILWVSVSPLWAQTSPNTIDIKGEATLYVVPDEVTISFGIVTENKNINIAKTQNDAILQEIKKLTQKYAVKEQNITIEQIQISPKYQYINNKNEFSGYQISKGISIKLTDVSIYEDFISALVDSGIQNLYSAVFSTSKLREYRDQARVAALQAAKEKGELVAKTLGVVLGKPVFAEEETFSYGYSNRDMLTQNRSFSESGSEETGVSLTGQIAVKATFHVVFAIK